MDGPFQEKDWKTMRHLKDELLQELCARINRQSRQILADESKSEHQRYLDLYRHIHDSDEIVAECFNDWRRSRLELRILSLRRHKLMTDEHVQRLSDGGQDWLATIESRRS